jgi:hypothetical protein
VATKTIADGYIELRIDDSKLDPEVKAKVSKVTNTFGSRLNKELQALSIEPIDLQADPRSALRAIDQTEEKLRELSRNAPTVELKIRAEAALRQLNTFSKKFGEVAPEAAVGFAANLSKKLDPLIASMPLGGPMGVAIAGAGVAVAPLLASILSGAIIGGAGIGGVVGGFMVAKRDARVKAAITGLGEEFQGRLEDAGGAFVEPALAGVARIDRALDTIDLEGIFRNSAEFVDPLAEGIGSTIEDIGDALETLISKAGPVIRQIGSGLAQFGESLADGLTLLADNAPEAAAGMELLFDALSSVTSTTLTTVNALTELYAISSKFGADFGLRVALKATSGALDELDGSARRGGGGTFVLNDSMAIAKDRADELKEATEKLKPVQDAVAAAQKALASTLDQVSFKNQTATLTSDSLRTAMDKLYGAAIRQTDANEAYETSWDALTGSVKANKASLDIHTEAGRANRDTLQALLGSNNDLYIANIAAGMSIDSARTKHENRTKAIIKEADKLGFNEKRTRELIKTYGQIPPEKATDLVVEGVNQIVIELKRLYIAQRALAEGKTVNEVRYEGSAAMRSLLAAGGPVYGPGGPTDDKVPAMLSAGEFVVRAASSAKIGLQNLNYLNKYGELPAFAAGGTVAPVEMRRLMRFPVDVSNTYVMSLAEAKRRVVPVFGNWPSSPAAQRGDSGVWKRVVQLINTGPDQGSFGNAYRPGDPKWHGSGRAVDWMGFNMDALASYLASKNPLELIHRTNKRDYAYTRGRNMGSFNASLMEAHRNHIHIAMREGGQVPRLLPFGSYDSGGRLPTGLSLAYNGTGRPEPVGHHLAGEVHMHFHGPVTSRQAAEDLVVEAYRSAKQRRRL